MIPPTNARAVATAIDARKSGPIPLTSGAALAPFNDCGGETVNRKARPHGESLQQGAGTNSHRETGGRLPTLQTRTASRTGQRDAGPPQSPMTPAQARAAGLRYYFGVACAYGHHRRYTSNRMCVTCSAAHHVARKAGTRREPPPPAPLEYVAPSREVGRRLGLVKYHGRPHICGSTVRYTCSTKCVECERLRNRKRAPR